MQARVLERDRACAASHSASAGIGREAALGPADLEHDLPPARRSSSSSPIGAAVGRADLLDLATVVEHATAGGACRLHRRVEDHRQQAARVVRGGQRVPTSVTASRATGSAGAAANPRPACRTRSSPAAEDNEQAERDDRRDDREA